MGQGSWRLLVAMACGVALACAKGEKIVSSPDSGPVDDGDAGGIPDSGVPDAGLPDAGTPDAGVSFGGPGPWPKDNVSYGAAQGLDLPWPGVVGFSTDETQNQWVATNSAIYLMRPGDTTFRRYDARDGLHLQSNPVQYCDSSFGEGADRSCPIAGAAADPGIREITGGGSNEVFVGYYSNHDWTSADDGTWASPFKHQGKIDRVRLKPDGTLDVVRFDLVCSNTVMYWHNRDPFRMVFDHFIHKHELYVGAEHGVDKISPDKWFEPTNPSWPYIEYHQWMSDHLHPHTCKDEVCTGDSNKDTQMMGGFAALAIDPFDGDLWVGSVYSAGKITYTEGATDWWNRAGAEAYSYTFGISWCGSAGQVKVWDNTVGNWVMTPCAPGQFGGPPVFPVPSPGDVMNINAVTVTPDRKSWWSSSIYGIASFDGHQFKYFTPAQAGTSSTVTDMVALPDGRLAVATQNDGLMIWNPDTGAHTAIRSGSGLPSNQVNRLELDLMVDPPALHVSTALGATTVRVFP
jgi:hypothetical protein